ncbi:hypothetical protein IF2G_01833 [Cordyceps javanica]|nr:hypothetical protein IF2G_01833 [Cordyceps javanica]
MGGTEVLSFVHHQTEKQGASLCQSLRSKAGIFVACPYTCIIKVTVSPGSHRETAEAVFRLSFDLFRR